MDFLTNLKHAGAQSLLPRSATRAEREALALHLHTLRAQGHALAVDETFEHGETTGDIRILHYKTCVQCIRGGK